MRRRRCHFLAGILCVIVPSAPVCHAEPSIPEGRTNATAGVDRRHTYVLPPEPEPERSRDSDRLGWYVPDFAKVQTGGLRGRYTAGIGYAAFDDVLNVGLLYGYSPNEVDDDGVSTLSFEIGARPFEIRADSLRIVPLEVGVGALYAVGDEFELRYPDRYSSGYYPPTAVHGLAYLGVEVDWVPEGGFFERVGLYYQVSTIYTYLRDVLENTETASLSDSFASTIGYRAAF